MDKRLNLDHGHPARFVLLTDRMSVIRQLSLIEKFDLFAHSKPMG